MTATAAERRTPWGRCKELWPWLAATFSGVSLALCYPRFDQSWLCWIALTPLICAVWFSRPPARRCWLRNVALGQLTGMVFFSITFGWLSSLGTLFENFWLHLLPELLSVYLALFFAFWSWFLGLLRAQNFLSSSRNLGIGFLGASGWVAQEWTRGWLFSGFGWNGLGVALHADLAMIQITEFTGVSGISFLIAFSNVMAVIIARRIIAEAGPGFLKKFRWEFSVSVGLIVLVFAFGVRALLHPANEKTVTLRVAAVQPDIPQLVKFESRSEQSFARAEGEIFRQLDTLTMFAAASQPQLLLWPESATPRGMFGDEVNFSFVQKEAQRGDFGLLLGTLDSDLQRQEDYNVATLLTHRGEDVQTYRKMHLVPFGEYLPLRHVFPLFALVAGQLVPADFTPGREYTLLQLPSPDVKLAALICFEDTVGDLARRFVRRGAQLLVNITNDGWFLRTAGAEQHLANAVFRAVENRRPLVRCANTGATCSVDSFGRVSLWLKYFERGFATREMQVPVQSTLTFYTLHGEVFAVLCACVTGVYLLSRIKVR